MIVGGFGVGFVAYFMDSVSAMSSIGSVVRVR